MDGQSQPDDINRPERPDFRSGNLVTWMDRHNSLSEVVHSLLHRLEELEERVSKLENNGTQFNG